MLSRWQSTIVDAQGNIQPFAILTVLNEATQTPAQIYASESESQPLPVGSVVADESGYAYFYAHGGRYRIQSTDLNIDWRHVPLGDLQGMDESDLGLGTAATRDVGTGPDDVPTNDDLGSAASLDVATTEQAEDLIDDDAVITPKKLGDAMSAHVLGMGQTWQDVTGSRLADVTYTNTTGRPIVVRVTCNNESASFNASLFVDGDIVDEVIFSYGSGSITLGSTLIAIAPPDATYSFGYTGGSWTRWMELR